VVAVNNWTFAVLLALAAPAAAQQNPWNAPVASTAAAVPVASTAPASYADNLGQPLSVSGGPWVLSEVLFFSAGRVVSDYAWRDRVRGRRGQIYTNTDLQNDVETLMGLGAFERVTPAVYAISGQIVPSEFAAVTISTNQVRVVFNVNEKPKAADAKPKLLIPPSAVSGLILTPTAYRGAGKFNNPGLGLDINAAYFIGRLYGKNIYQDSPRKTNYIDRIGLWTLTADGKMQVQSDAGWRPAVAVGGQHMLVFRDSPQPTVATPGVSVKVNSKNTKTYTSGYVVASKNLRSTRVSAGLMQGGIGEFVSGLSEFLTPEALKFYAHDAPGTEVHSRTVPFASVFYLVKPDYPIGFEVMKFNGAATNPYMVNFKIGRLLKLNFDLAYLKFRGGYEVLGLFQFRYNHFPRN